MKKALLLIWTFALAVLFSAPCGAANTIDYQELDKLLSGENERSMVRGGEDVPTNPVDHAGKKWTIGFYECGPNPDNEPVMKSLLAGLKELGWMAGADPAAWEKAGGGAVGLWRNLSELRGGRFLDFSGRYCWSADWDEARRRANREEALAALQARKLDLIVAMDAWAGLDLADIRHSVPTMCLSSIDPKTMGVVPDLENNVMEHVFVRVDPYRNIRQLQVFHCITDFKRLGVVYEDTPEGRAAAGLEDVQRAAADFGFQVIPCRTNGSPGSHDEAVRGLKACWEKIAPRIDALYITPTKGVSAGDLPAMIEPLVAHRIPTFSQAGLPEVRHGALFGIEAEPNKPLGRFYAETMAKLFHGASPGDMDRVFAGRRKIVINVETARKIGFDVPKNLLKAADVIIGQVK